MEEAGTACKIKSGDMKIRLLNGWTWQRVIFIVLGLAIFIQSVADRQWFGMIFGIYFFLMGLFAIGCAAGNCYRIYRSTQVGENNKTGSKDVEYEEIK